MAFSREWPERDERPPYVQEGGQLTPEMVRQAMQDIWRLGNCGVFQEPQYIEPWPGAFWWLPESQVVTARAPGR